jgi:FAD/FMN-containing dehydrogenase
MNQSKVTTHQTLIEGLRQTFSGRLLTDAPDMAAYLIDWRKRYQGQALAVVEPINTEEVANIVRFCAKHAINIIPQGGNTSLSGGSVPNPTGKNIVIGLKRLNQIREIDAQNNTMTVEAGCILEAIQIAAKEVNRLFPLSLASQGSCTIGGNLATNAGGVQVLRYGNTRELCLGLEVVTAEGNIWHGLRGLRKDNTGYNLKDLFIGSEGTLGIITAAVLKLFPLPAFKQLAWVAVQSTTHALQLLTLSKQHTGDSLTAFELISDNCLNLVLKHFKQCDSPLKSQSPWYILLEVSENRPEESHKQYLYGVLCDMLKIALETHLILDAVVSDNEQQFKRLWTLRESISAAQTMEGANIKHDIALPISKIPAFIEKTEQTIRAGFPDAHLITFGHLGDGNLHYNVYHSKNSRDNCIPHQVSINRIVHDAVDSLNGSISAEHGLGVLRRDEAARYKSPVELNLMLDIKQALDPHNRMNPDKVLLKK